MNIFQMLRRGMLGLGANKSNNNRSMTRGRVASGKSTFKGCEAEHQQVKLKKEIEETARMVFAIDIKLDNHPSDAKRMELLEEREDLTDKLNYLLEVYEEVVSSSTFDETMEVFDQEERHRRKRRGLAMP